MHGEENKLTLQLVRNVFCKKFLSPLNEFLYFVTENEKLLGLGIEAMSNSFARKMETDYFLRFTDILSLFFMAPTTGTIVVNA